MNKNLTEEEFDELIYDDEAQSVILFHKQGCGACRDAASQLEGLEGFDGWTVAGVDALQERGLFSRFGLNGVPQVLLFREGRLVRTLSGRKSQAEYQHALEFFDEQESNPSPGNFTASKKCSGDICYFADDI